MPRKPQKFRQRDVSRLLRSYTALGLPPPVVRITSGGDLLAVPSGGPVDDATSNPWDAVIS